jgi:hypothetical protein
MKQHLQEGKQREKKNGFPLARAAGKALLYPLPARKSFIRSLHCDHPGFYTGVPDKGGACRVVFAV